MADGIKALGKGALSSILARRKRMLKAQEARSALSVLARQNGPLSPSLKRRAREDAVERLGASRHALWLMVYAAVQGEYRDGWLPDSYYLETVMPRINGIAHHLGRVRASNRAFFDNPAVPDLFYILNGRIIGANYAALSPMQAIEVMRAHGPHVVFKADQSGFGRGVHTVNVADVDAKSVLALGNGVVQPMIIGHPLFDQIGSGALATLRIGTVLPNTGPPEVRTCYLKLGRAGQAHVIAKDQIRIGVDWTNGALSADGYLSDWQRIDACPRSGAKFAGLSIPAIGAAVKTVLDLHSSLPLARYVCWDIAIDRHEKVHLLEWEGGVVSFAEAVQGPCFADLRWEN